MNHWTAANIPSLLGKLAVVTGSTSGLGYEIALALAGAGADLIVAGRDEAKGRWVVGKIRSLAPAVLVRFERLDLANLQSVADFAGRMLNADRPVDLLIDNAGVLALPSRKVTVDGFELQFATNYLGHFALTGLLFPLLRQGRQPRVVQVSSVAHRHGAIHLDDLQLERGYRPWKAYCQSKLAMLLFALELQRRSNAGGWGILSMAAHPGYARTDQFAKGPGRRSLVNMLHRGIGNLFSHSAAAGALPTLFAATALHAKPGEYYGPQGPLGFAGPPGEAEIGIRARDAEKARELWAISERLTGVKWPSV